MQRITDRSLRRRGPLAQPYNERFEDYISPEPNSGCWLWDGNKSADRYPKIWVNGTGISAHRFSYEKYRGQIPAGLCVCHHCDVPICVNPDHLFLGTHADNVADKMRKDRHIKGVEVNNSKLTPEQVLIIRGSTGTQKSIARQYGVNQSTVWAIHRRKIWKHL